MIVFIVKKRRAAALAAIGIGNSKLNETTIVMNHNQPTYGVAQPIHNPTMEMMNQPFQPMYPQPVYGQPMHQPVYGQPMPQQSGGFGYDQFMGGSY